MSGFLITAASDQTKRGSISKEQVGSDQKYWEICSDLGIFPTIFHSLTTSSFTSA